MARLFTLAVLVFVSFVSFNGCKSEIDSSKISQQKKEKALCCKSSPSELGVFREGKSIKSDGNLILLVFGSDDCFYCEKLIEDIYRNKDLASILKDDFASYYVSLSQNTKYDIAGASLTTSELASTYGVRSTPTLIFMTSTYKTLLAYPGYIPVERLRATLGFLQDKSISDLTQQEIAHKYQLFCKQRGI